VVVLAAFFFLS